ncbi:Hypothetical predicted protein [Mytilus galloprovincialis]|uniref:Reverse transcriptase domain-containing protein n=1 Tax=Mytilus galloprovincialis TaxID=29158 RepID=A0A8B6G6C7_MYTGA|nr:Hypothetical predicted protein [Mytilus galloprovincialis]
MVECNLKTNSKGLTFINVNGIDTSEIDYFLYTDPKCEPSKRLIDLPSNVSDHHPISMRIKCNITREQQSRNSEKQKHKIRWNKVDKSRYEETISRNIGDFIERLNFDKVNIEVITLQAMDLLSDTAKQLDQKKTYGKNKLKLNEWNKEISESLEANKLAYKNWKSAGRPPNIDNILLTEKKLTRKNFRTAIRNEEIRRKHNERNDIINYNQNDKQKFFKLIRKQRQNGNTFINDLHVENEIFERNDILKGWNQHFSKLAIPSEHPDFNYQHLALCEMDYVSIKRISEHYATRYVDLDTIEKAIKSINKGKAEDVFGISIENVLYAGQQFKLFLHKLINRMLQDRVLPDIIKTGLLSPVFKNKGDKNDAKYYRGITVLPILLKIIEFILRIDLRSGSLKLQSILQKGFTANTSPLNAAIILEEVYREYMDKKLPFYIVLLDAKSAFDVVVLKMLLRKPQKSVVIQVQPSNRKKSEDPVRIYINNNAMPISDKSPHLGILRSTTSQKTQDATVEQNITKSRRAAYSLMSAGMHGENGLDPSTAIQLFKTFVQPILTYGLEVILPTSKNLLKLETFQKKILKQILSVPITAPDPSVYIMSGILPIEAQIDQKSLNLFNNICNQNENHLEKKIARRQLIAKNQESNSWFIAIKRYYSNTIYNHQSYF